MKNKIYVSMVFVLVFIGLYFNNKLNKKSQNPIILDIKQVKPIKHDENLVVLNYRNSQINSIFYEKIIIQTKGLHLNSSLFYEKQNNFRMINSSVFGKETDIGSNEDYFWFWSKRMQPAALFYTQHENLHKTNLRTPFHPIWIMEIIGVNSIDLKDVLVFQHKNNLAVSKNDLSVTGKPITRVYLIDTKKMTFCGHYIFDKNDKLIISAEIIEFHKINDYFLPKEIIINWFEEDIQVNWKLQSPVINGFIDAENWNMPNINYKIDLNGYMPY